jgi:hypothetical protein
MYHHSVMSCSWPFGEAVHDSLWVVYTPPIGVVFFGELSRVLLQGHKLRLGARYWLGAPNGWDTTGCPQVLDHSVGDPYTRFLSGPPDNPTSIHKFGSKSGWVEGSSPYLSLNRLL